MFELLASLIYEYKQVRTQILNMNLSSLNEVHDHIHREEGRRGVMNMPYVVEKSVFLTTSSRGGRGGSSTRGCGRYFST